MGFSYRKRIKTGTNSHLNVSKSGVSATKKLGPVTVNSSGRVTIRLGPGMTWRL